MLFPYLLKSIIRKGSLTLIAADGKTRTYGDGTPPEIAVKLHRKSLEWTLGLDPELKIGEAFVDGSMTIEEGDIYGFLRLLLANYKNAGKRSFFYWRERFGDSIKKLRQFNPIPRARHNAQFHYDMPDQLYAFFLDKDRQYSCGYFADKSVSLDQAQLDKKRHIASKLLLDRPGLKVLDIGSGWGGLGLYLARETDSIVKGVTLSVNQYKISKERAHAEGLAKRCAFDLRDYRQETGSFDRIVSVGMFEHIGKKHYDEFFTQLRRLLAHDGVGLIHTIGRYGEPKAVNSFIRKHIFPGTDVPTTSEIMKAADRAGLFVTDIEVLREHYAETLQHWLMRYRAHRSDIVKLFGENLYRKWEFYFAGSEASFRIGSLMVLQIQLSKQLRTVPTTRDYMIDWERGTTGYAAGDEEGLAPAPQSATLRSALPLDGSKRENDPVNHFPARGLGGGEGASLQASISACRHSRDLSSEALA